MKFKVNHPPKNNKDLNQGLLHLWSKFGDPSLNGWWVIARTSLWMTHGRMDTQKDAGNDNTRRPKLASGNNKNTCGCLNSIHLTKSGWSFSRGSLTLCDSPWGTHSLVRRQSHGSSSVWFRRSATTMTGFSAQIILTVTKPKPLERPVSLSMTRLICSICKRTEGEVSPRWQPAYSRETRIRGLVVRSGAHDCTGTEAAAHRVQSSQRDNDHALDNLGGNRTQLSVHNARWLDGTTSGK